MQRDTEKRKRYRALAARRELRKTQRQVFRIAAAIEKRKLSLTSWTGDLLRELAIFATALPPMRSRGLDRTVTPLPRRGFSRSGG